MGGGLCENSEKQPCKSSIFIQKSNFYFLSKDGIAIMDVKSAKKKPIPWKTDVDKLELKGKDADA